MDEESLQHIPVVGGIPAGNREMEVELFDVVDEGIVLGDEYLFLGAGWQLR